MLSRDEGSATVAVGPSGRDPETEGADFLPERNLKSQARTVATAADIQALTRAVWRGEPDAFARFYDLFSFRLYKFLLVLSRGDENEAREVCQTVFIKLARRCDVFDDERRLWAWLCVLARNTFIDHCRNRQRRNRFVPLDVMPIERDAQVNPELRLSEVLHEALAALAPDERELIQAAYVDKQPLARLAQEARQSYKAMESRLGRLRQKLKERLLKDLRDETELGS